MKMHVLRALVIFLALAVLSACRPTAAKTELLVSSAVSLKDAMQEIALAFEKEHPGTHVIFNFGASGSLAQQILQGAPCDLFVSAAADQVEELCHKGILEAETIRECAGNRLVVIAREGRCYSSLADLANVERLAIGNPRTVPCGEYARKALTRANLYDLLVEKNKLVLAEDARQILAYVEGGDVDAGIAYNTDALLAQKSKVCFSIPGSYTGRMFYKIAVIKNSHQKELSGQFLAFVTGAQAKKDFQQRGFCF